jgi:hypothetical protein
VHQNKAAKCTRAAIIGTTSGGARKTPLLTSHRDSKLQRENGDGTEPDFGWESRSRRAKQSPNRDRTWKNIALRNVSSAGSFDNFLMISGVVKIFLSACMCSKTFQIVNLCISDALLPRALSQKYAAKASQARILEGFIPYTWTRSDILRSRSLKK